MLMCICFIDKVIMERDKMKTDLSALFMPRQPSMNLEEAVNITNFFTFDCIYIL